MNLKEDNKWVELIMAITLKIETCYPELSKYIIEIPLKSNVYDTRSVHIDNLKAYYYTLNEIFEEYSKSHEFNELIKTNIDKFPGYPLYFAQNDIYNRSKKLSSLNPENLSKIKTNNESINTMNEKDYETDMSGSDLDVPGTELDDQQESVGSEDEENNYYSLGGDNHNDLEEDRG